ncbi:DUF882 domain-containing protein [Microvirga tunisiensis]|uniref:Murein endopeptidase K n=2 Tax=Pannonibacter tanglangensis TaxID=2750084 RepID=A0ABW9ZK69_9HYPH|nr:DUF882 domain-containing protein [Pannonibacter sp. XCT-34]
MGALFLGPSVMAPDLSAASAETRTLKLYNTHTKERVQITFKKDGRYIPSGLREANRFLRDWRRNEITNIDPKLLDLVWEVYQQVRGNDYIHVVSSYRSPATNNMLRSRSRGVAKNSQHSLGKAMDFFIPGVDLATLRATGLRKQVGGVGFYPTSGSPFVHLDTGSVRHWPKMSRQQLARVFPDGRTVHIPADGKPMPGYQQALADLKAGRRGSSNIVIASGGEDDEGGSSVTTGQVLSSGENGDLVRPAPGTSRGFLATLFSGEDDEVEEAAATGREAPTRQQPARQQQQQQQQRPGAVGQAPGVRTPPAPVAVAAAERPAPAPAPAAAEAVIAAAPPRSKPQTEDQAPQSIPFQVAAVDPNARSAEDVLAENATSGPALLQAAEGRGQTPALSVVPTAKPRELVLAAAAPVATPRPAPQIPASDPMAAIAAATGTEPLRKPQMSTSALAYASPAATELQMTSRQVLQMKAAAAAAKMAKDLRKPAKPAPTVSGLVPPPVIVDPLAGFASLPDKSSPELISGTSTLRSISFADMSHPNQRQIGSLLTAGNRFIKHGFGAQPYDNLRSDTFTGTAISVLPVVFTR